MSFPTLRPEVRRCLCPADEITLKILVALQIKLTEGERALALAKGTQNLGCLHEGHAGSSICQPLHSRGQHAGPAGGRGSVGAGSQLSDGLPVAQRHLSDGARLRLRRAFRRTLRKADEWSRRRSNWTKNLAEGHAFMGRIYLAAGNTTRPSKEASGPQPWRPIPTLPWPPWRSPCAITGSRKSDRLYRKACGSTPAPHSEQVFLQDSSQRLEDRSDRPNIPLHGPLVKKRGGLTHTTPKGGFSHVTRTRSVVAIGVVMSLAVSVAPTNGAQSRSSRRRRRQRRSARIRRPSVR